MCLHRGQRVARASNITLIAQIGILFCYPGIWADASAARGMEGESAAAEKKEKKNVTLPKKRGRALHSYILNRLPSRLAADPFIGVSSGSS